MTRRKRFATYILAAAIALSASVAAPALAADNSSSDHPVLVTIVTPTYPGGALPTVEPRSPFNVTAPDGRDLGPAAHLTLPAAAPKKFHMRPLSNEQRHLVGVSARRSDATDRQLELPARGSQLAAGADGMTPAAAADYSIQDYERADINDCIADGATYDGPAVPYNHMFACSGAHLTATVYQCGWFGCDPVAWTTFRLTAIGYGTPNERKVVVVSMIDDVKVFGEADLIEAESLALSMTCTPEPGWGTECLNNYPAPITKTVAQWAIDGRGNYFEFSAPATDGWGPDLESLYDYGTNVAMVGANSVTVGQGQFRCDMALYISFSSGCAFPSDADFFGRLSLSDPLIAAASAHVSNAQNFPDSTMPPSDLPKFIPGGPLSDRPLTRMYDPAVSDKSNDIARRACKKYFSDYKHKKQLGLTLDCDEYPFASTYENAASGGDFSVQPIDSADNQAAGRALNAWYNTFRILDGDNFYVVVRP